MQIYVNASANGHIGNIRKRTMQNLDEVQVSKEKWESEKGLRHVQALKNCARHVPDLIVDRI